MSEALSATLQQIQQHDPFLCQNIRRAVSRYSGTGREGWDRQMAVRALQIGRAPAAVHEALVAIQAHVERLPPEQKNPLAREFLVAVLVSITARVAD